MALKSRHQMRVEEFMRKAGQEVPSSPTIPDDDIRLLRAKLIMEEALETIKALGVEMEIDARGVYDVRDIEFYAHDRVDIVEVVDGCCDIIVVTTGTLSSFGVADIDFQLAIDKSNLAKFAEGGYRRADGKWVKPPDWTAPPIAELLRRQGYLE